MPGPHPVASSASGRSHRSLESARQRHSFGGSFDSRRVCWCAGADRPETKKKPKKPKVTLAVTLASDVDAALALALTKAAEAGRFDVVAQLARELEARRLAGSNVVTIDARKGGAK